MLAVELGAEAVWARFPGRRELEERLGINRTPPATSIPVPEQKPEQKPVPVPVPVPKSKSGNKPKSAQKPEREELKRNPDPYDMFVKFLSDY
jgi:hypothetical protein